MKKLWLPVLIALLAGCAAQKIKEDNNPFANAYQGNPVRKLSLALVLPSVQVMKKRKAIDAPVLAQKNKTEPETMYREVLGIYYQTFKRVTLVKDLNDPRVADADLVGTLESTLVSNAPLLNMTVSFYNLDHSLITSFKLEAKAPGSILTIKPEEAFPMVITKIPDLLDQKLKANSELKTYAKGVTPKAEGQVQARAEVKNAVIDSDVDRPGYNFDENANNYAVIVGVENYQNLPSAIFADRDAHAVKAHLRALGYPAQNIIMLTDAQATGTAIRSYVESWLPRNVKEDSKVFFYFSGHGAPDTESKQAYLVPWDGDSQFLSDTGYPVKRLYQKLNALKAKQVVVAMDSCFSGAGGHSVVAKGARPLMTTVDTGNSDDMGKVVVLAAAGAEEITGAEDAQGHGLFTYYMLKGLNASAGKDSVGAIYGYLRPKVEAAARQSNRGQTPQMMGRSAQQTGKESLR
ncbi:MAG: caspase family protein [Elusimicrobiota bacterium]